MPGYGISDETDELLPWAWALQRLTESHNYWVGSSDPAGGPHAAVVWGVWHRDGLWFSTGGGSRKARNLRREPRCTVATEGTADALVVSGRAEVVTGVAVVEEVRGVYAAKYGEGFPEAGADPLFRVRPKVVLATPEEDFTRRPTRWRFPP
jgi:general stress protein 26